ncbi:hypothetical protein CRE_17961 [Caenorhabditis remanei]|uniref:Uncharacterized protein n=1 Tax=Caenorhabditis remanei TaxID=31234 RepID=E3MDS3_CAERE|nr:hypothetical protein CRE_17961 [Caenorhabditis remanei]
MATASRNVSMRLLAPGDEKDVMTYVPYRKGMVSMRTLTWTFILMQLVISCACFIASLAIISAKFNSVSVYEEKQYVSFEWWIFCGLSFSMIINTVAAMYALSEHNRFLLIPHILVLILCNSLACYVLHYTVSNFDSTDFNWHIGLMTIIFTGHVYITFCNSREFPAIMFGFRGTDVAIDDLNQFTSLYEKCQISIIIIFLFMFNFFKVSLYVLLLHNSFDQFSRMPALFTGDYGIFKFRTIIFLSLQAVISLFVLVGAVPLSLDTDNKFPHPAIRPIILILLTITFIWFISSILAVYVVFRDLKLYLRVHICFNSVILTLYLTKLVILIASGDIVTSVFCVIVNLINFYAVYYEIKFHGTFE